MNAWVNLATIAHLQGTPADEQFQTWDQATRIADEIAACNQSVHCRLDLAKLRMERAVSMSKLERWDESLADARSALALCRDLLPHADDSVINILSGVILVSVTVASKPSKDREERLHEARSYCQLGVALVTECLNAQTASLDRKRIYRQFVDAWRSKIDEIEHVLTTSGPVRSLGDK